MKDAELFGKLLDLRGVYGYPLFQRVATRIIVNEREKRRLEQEIKEAKTALGELTEKLKQQKT